MDRDYLVLKRASTSRPSGEWNDDDYDVLAVDVVVGRIMKAAAAPVDAPWLWTLAFRAPRGPHADARLRGDARGGDGGFREVVAAGIATSHSGPATPAPSATALCLRGLVRLPKSRP